MSARGGLFGADGGDNDFDDVLNMFEPFGLIIVDAADNGHKKARCNSHPTSDIMLAFRKYGVTSRKNLTIQLQNDTRKKKRRRKRKKKVEKRMRKKIKMT